MRRLEEDKEFFNWIVEKTAIQKDSKELYTVSPNVGRGTVQGFSPMSGIEVLYSDFQLYEPIRKSSRLKEDCIEITYLLNGEVEVEFKNGRYSYMSSGDICLFGYNAKALYCDFSSKHFTGINIMIYFPDIVNSLNKILETKEFKAECFFREVLTSDSCIIKHASEGIEHIFKELFVLPKHCRNHLMKVKVIELLLYLISDLDYEKNETVYFSKSSVEKIKEARRIIIGNIDKHITIKEISQRVNMNSTDLEKGFKNVYGDTIFSYGRSYRMKKAKELLSDTKLSVLDVALACGYSSCGKLSKAFKDTFYVTPAEYRKR